MELWERDAEGIKVKKKLQTNGWHSFIFIRSVLSKSCLNFPVFFFLEVLYYFFNEFS